VHRTQCAFIKVRSIHENFKFVHSSARLLHARRKGTILFKADLSKAFDSVAWAFLIEILCHLVVELLRSAKTKVLLNGAPCQRICHVWGLHQGDMLSPLLFILVMEVLGAMFQKADGCELLQAMGTRQIKHHLSLYADDLIMFITPVAFDISLTSGILELFEGASGLRCNLSKCQIAPIRCDETQVNLATSYFPCAVVEFPIRYLGIPLSVTKLPKTAWQYLIDSVADKLPSWKGGLMHRSGRLTLIKLTLSMVSVHTAISLELPA
jgi:hypothetical protein